MGNMSLNELMIEQQLIKRGISKKNVIEAFRKTPRHLFVPPKYYSDAYGDHPLPIGEGQTISQPFIVARMLELLDVSEEMSVLEIGTGSGYQTALLSHLAKNVYTIERIETLSLNAQRTLKSLDIKNVIFKVGDGTLGWREFAPFERVIITAASPDVPPPLFEQLKEFGKMVVPVGERFHQVLTLVEKLKGKKIVTEMDDCIFVPLIGKYGMER